MLYTVNFDNDDDDDDDDENEDDRLAGDGESDGRGDSVLAEGIEISAIFSSMKVCRTIKPRAAAWMTVAAAVASGRSGAARPAGIAAVSFLMG